MDKIYDTPNTMEALHICSWNIWFENVAQYHRINEIMSEIGERNPDVVCFQEATWPLIQYIEASIHTESFNVLYDEYPLRSYGQIFLISKRFDKDSYTFKSVPFTKTRMNRRMCILSLHQFNLDIINIHLESEFVNKNTRSYPYTKYGQLNEVLNKGKSGDHQTVIIGDFNMSQDDDSVFNQALEKRGYTCISANQLTYDHTANSNIKGIYKSALDRAVCNWPPVHELHEMLGQTPFVLNGLFFYPSDHFGLDMSIKISKD